MTEQPQNTGPGTAGGPPDTPAAGQVPPAAPPAAPHAAEPPPYGAADHPAPAVAPPHPSHPGAPPVKRAVTVPLGKMLFLITTALGVVNLLIGYVNNGDLVSANLYDAPVAIIALTPTLFFLGGLFALRGYLPGERAPGATPALITTAIYVTLVLSALGSDGGGDLQILFLVFGGLQLAMAWLAYLFDAGILSPANNR